MSARWANIIYWTLMVGIVVVFSGWIVVGGWVIRMQFNGPSNPALRGVFICEGIIFILGGATAICYIVASLVRASVSHQMNR